MLEPKWLYQKSDFYKNPIFYKNPRGPGVGGLGGASIDFTPPLGGRRFLIRFPRTQIQMRPCGTLEFTGATSEGDKGPACLGSCTEELFFEWLKFYSWTFFHVELPSSFVQRFQDIIFSL